jgi:hypothetical protein
MGIQADLEYANSLDRQELNDLIVAVDTLEAGITGKELKLIAGMAMKEAVQQHLYALAADAEHHRTSLSLGAARTGLYSKAADHTHDPEVEGGDVSVAIEDENGALAQRRWGGDIEAPEGHLLTIAARTEAYGHRAREFANLRLIMFPSGAGALIERDATILRGGKRGKGKLAGSLEGRRKGAKIGGLIFFWLVKQVHQEPDPSILPTDAELLEPALQNVSSYISRTWAERRAA